MYVYAVDKSRFWIRGNLCVFITSVHVYVAVECNQTYKFCISSWQNPFLQLLSYVCII